jgi:hypothetical protein
MTGCARVPSFEKADIEKHVDPGLPPQGQGLPALVKGLAPILWSPGETYSDKTPFSKEAK